MSPLFNLGAVARCKVTGYKGVIVTRREHLNGCWRYDLQAPCGADGKMPDGYIFDEKVLELMPEPGLQHAPVKTGGPMESFHQEQA